jgi:type VI secretion system protein VasD
MTKNQWRLAPRARMALACLCMCLHGCASAPSAPAVPALPEGAPAVDASAATSWLGGLADKALEATGLKKPALPDVPDVPDSALPDWRVSWRVYASPSLNVNPAGEPLSVVMRFYKLKSPDAFLRAPQDTFGDAAKEKEVLGEDIVGVREVPLLPGQQHEATDKVSRAARYVGVVALFRSPAQGHWRYAFDVMGAQLKGIGIGVHACAMSVQVGEPIGVSVKAARSAAVPCP